MYFYNNSNKIWGCYLVNVSVSGEHASVNK